jgi:hypothetical protein
MSDQFSKWQRPLGKPETKKPLEVKWRATHAGSARPKDGSNPYKAEADRDRVIFRWVMLLLVVAGLAIYVMVFLGK